MSTHAAIIMKDGDVYRGIYCHFDGYVEHVGATLLKHYSDKKKVRALIKLGDISCLGERVAPIGEHSFKNREEGTTVAYHRDRGEELSILECDDLDELASRIPHSGYVYVFMDGRWKRYLDERFADIL